MNKKPLNILILEDNPDDAELMVAELEKGGCIITHKIVDTKEGFKKFLSQSPDLILADYKLPSVNALDALRIKQEIAPTIPLIIVSGTIGEEFAVECIKAGATDYVLKDRLFRLCPVVERALKEAKEYKERKQLEEELLVKNEVFEASITANSTSDNEGILTYVNNAFIKIFGYKNKEEAVGKSISDFLKFEDEAINIITALSETGVWEGEYTGLRKDGTTFVAYGLATIIKDGSGDNIGYQSAVLDISDRKRIEKNLKESEEKYSSVVENSLDGIIVLQKGIIKFLNQAILDLTGYDLEELIDKEFESLLSPEYRKLIMDRYRARLSGKDVPSLYEMEIIRKDGISVPIEVSNTKITYWGEEATLSFIRNITERKKAEEELERAHASTKLILEKVQFGVVIIGKDKKIRWINETARKMAGIENVDVMLGKPCYEYLCPTEQNKCPILDEGQKVDNSERIFRQYNGKEIPIIKTVNEINFDNENVLLETFIDITERKQAEEKEKEHHKNIELLSETAIQFVEFPQDKDIYTFIGEKLKEFTGKNSIIVVSSIDTEKDIMTTRKVLGLGKISKKVVGLLGRHPVSMTFDAKDKTLSDLSDGKLHLNEEGLYGILLKTVPKTVCNSIEKLLNIKKIYGIGFTKENNLFGTAVIFFKEDAGELKNKQTIETFIKQASIAIQRRRAEERLKETMDATIQTMSKIIEVKDPYTSGHQQRVSQLAIRIAQEIKLPKDKIKGIKIASLIHDIGKIGVPTEILSKTTTLSDIEFSLIKEHSQIGYDILKSVDFSYPVAQIVLQHHEKINGTGYPKGLKRDEILLEAKILGVADVVEAMSSHRPYRPALGIDAALEEITQNKGTLYDIIVVDACLKLFKEKEFKFKQTK